MAIFVLQFNITVVDLFGSLTGLHEIFFDNIQQQYSFNKMAYIFFFKTWTSLPNDQTAMIVSL